MKIASKHPTVHYVFSVHLMITKLLIIYASTVSFFCNIIQYFFYRILLNTKQPPLAYSKPFYCKFNTTESPYACYHCRYYCSFKSDGTTKIEFQDNLNSIDAYFFITQNLQTNATL